MEETRNIDFKPNTLNSTLLFYQCVMGLGRLSKATHAWYGSKLIRLQRFLGATGVRFLMRKKLHDPAHYLVPMLGFQPPHAAGGPRQTSISEYTKCSRTWILVPSLSKQSALGCRPPAFKFTGGFVVRRVDCDNYSGFFFLLMRT